jgi:hypothetical protein
MENLYALTPSDCRISTSPCSQVQNESERITLKMANWPSSMVSLLGGSVRSGGSLYHVAMVVVVSHVPVPSVLDPSSCGRVETFERKAGGTTEQIITIFFREGMNHRHACPASRSKILGRQRQSDGFRAPMSTTGLPKRE